MKQTEDKYIVRFPTGMRHTIKERALRNRRTMNAEIIYCIEQHLNTEKEKGVTEAATSSRHVQQSQSTNGDYLNELTNR